MLNRYKGYRTVLVNVLGIVAFAISTFVPESDVPSIDEIQAAVGVLWGLGNIALRAVTDTPIFRGER